MHEGQVRVKSIEVSDGGKTLLSVRNVRLPLASVSALVGPSGGGKTIAAQALLGLLPVAAPNLSATREVVFPDVGGPLRISYVPQGTGNHLQPTVVLRAQMRGLICGQGGLPPAAYSEERVVQLLRETRIPAPERTLDLIPAELSGGMLQRILLVIALMRRPHFMVLDEPTTALDGYARSQVYKLILECCQEHDTAVLLLTHSAKDISVLADWVYAIENGRVSSPAASGAIVSGPPKDGMRTDIPVARQAQAQARVTLPQARFAAESLSAVLQPKNLFQPFSWGRGPERRPFVLEAFSVALQAGDCFGLIGESGCGKTTLLRALGLLTEAQGSIRLDGQELSALSAKNLRAQRRYFQTVFQDSSKSLNPFLSVRELLNEPRALHGYPALTDADLQKNLESALLPQDILDQRIGELSFGQRQRLALLRALTGFPELKALILDEPFAGLDHEATLAMSTLWRARSAELVTIIASHDIEWISALCTHIHLMKAGAHIETIRQHEKFASEYARQFWEAGWIANRDELLGIGAANVQA